MPKASNQKSLMDRMVIDCEKRAEKIINFIQKEVKQQGKDGIVLGLSGGVDSSTVAFLVARAIKDYSKVHVLYLPDYSSKEKLESNVQEIVQRFGFRFKRIPITEKQNRKGYEKFIIKCINIFPFLNKFLVWFFKRVIYPLWFKKLPILVILKKKKPPRGFFKKTLYNLGTIMERGFNAGHGARRKVLEEYASSHNLLPVGCANHSEFFVGWFNKGGIDNLPIAPILALYKNQVRQLASWLGVPKQILEEKASPDMILTGIKDEDYIGYSYEKIDKVAYVIENNLNPQLAFREGITPKEFEEIKKINKFSEWKREGFHKFPTFKDL